MPRLVQFSVDVYIICIYIYIHTWGFDKIKVEIKAKLNKPK